MRGWPQLDRHLLDWNRRRRRSQAIRAELPDALELWALMLQAGLDIRTALQHYLIDGPAGPLKSDLESVARELQMGAARAEALRQLAQRTDEPNLRETLRGLIQGLELGAALAPLLRSQARALRRQRALEAEKQAAQAPLKLLFPLIVFIFPTVFLVLFGPLALSLSQGTAR